MAVSYKDYYETLGVPKTATEKEIKSAYRKRARTWHPDTNRDDPKAAEEKFKELQEAYEVLGDPEKRRKYDALGPDWKNVSEQAEAQRRYRAQQSARGNGAGARTSSFTFDENEAGEFGGAGFSDFFDTFFSGVGRRETATGGLPRRGRDIEASIDVSLRDAYSGAAKTVSMQLDDVCPECGGTGVLGRRVCPTCHGTGRFTTTKTLEIRIPRGVRDGQRIRLTGQGGRGIHGGPPGDLYLAVRLEDDPQFEREGDDLYVDVPVSFYTLALGGTVRVPTMTGHVEMKIPPETQSEQLLRLARKGMPHPEGDGYGDEYVRVVGQLPTPLTDEERKAFRELAKLHPV